MMINTRIQELIKQMTLEEKASLCSGSDFWHTKSIERLGIPRFMVSDGPHGLRKQDQEGDHLGINDSIKAVCFPAGCGLAASFNRELLTTMGEALGNECQAEGVSVILGPAVNIKRSPLGGRNFEYLSEDPLVAAELAGALIQGIQSKKVGTSIKHFLANNQETRRLSVSSEIDERALREIYLAAFEGAVTKQKPWTVMCSYNKINGVYAAENKTYLSDVLRGEWDFDGFVVSDWGAVNDRVAGLAAGLDLEMPDSAGENDKLIVEAVKQGVLEEGYLDLAVERILGTLYCFEENRDKSAVFDRDKDHELSRKVAEETIVLLKNEEILPLNANEKIVFIGEFAAKPRYQGGGSSHINSHKVDSALDMVNGMDNITYVQGYHEDQDDTEGLLQEAVEAAKKAAVAVIFAGLPDSYESESFDRSHMRIPECQNKLIEQVSAVQPNTVVVLHNGSPVEMPWVDNVKGILEAYLGGQAIGGAIVDILFGNVNPSGKLPETFPRKLEDNPSYLNFPGEGDKVSYKEGIFVGYRYYDKKKMEVLFPFGHGLSYTTFEYSNLKLSEESIQDTDTVTVTVDITNTGKMAGKEIVQLYVSDKISKVIRPVKELKEFAKVELQPKETKTIAFVLGRRAFAYYNTQIHDWHVESGEFDIIIGKSSAEPVLSKTLQVNSTVPLPITFTRNTIVGDLMEYDYAKEMIAPYVKLFVEMQKEDNEVASAAITQEMKDAMIQYMPLRGILSFAKGVTMKELDEMIERLNQEAIKHAFTI